MIKTLKTLIGLFLIFILAFYLIRGRIKQHKLKDEGRFTIGTTYGSNGKFVKYKFSVEGVVYEDEGQKLKFPVITDEGRYFVKYLPSDLTISEIYWDKPVPDSIKESPQGGWDSIPSRQ